MNTQLANLPETAAKIVSFPRRLFAIMAVDVAGYSKLVELDEPGTLEAWHRLRCEVLEASVSEHRGTVLERRGDGLLITFDSAVHAVQCAADLQAKFAGSATRSTGPSIQLRIGIHLGDVPLVAGTQFEGHGVNVAFRLETLSPVGGVLVSKPVRDEAERLLPFRFEDLGPHRLKNLARPVHVFRLRTTPGRVVHAGLNSCVASNEYLKHRIAIVRIRSAAAGADLEPIGESIVAELTSALSRAHDLRVCSTAELRDAPSSPADVWSLLKGLDAQYGISGVARRSDGRIRVTMEIFESGTLSIIWAETFEGHFDDPFGLEDKIVRGVTRVIQSVIQGAERARVVQRPFDELEPKDCIVRAMPLIQKLTTREFLSAPTFLRRAYKLNPACADAYAWHAWWYLLKVGQGMSPNPAADTAAASRLIDKALDHDPGNPLALTISGHVTGFLLRDSKLAMDLMGRALHKNPASMLGWSVMGLAQCYSGHPEAALKSSRLALKVGSTDPHANMYVCASLTLANLLGRRFDSAVQWGQRMLQVNPNFTAGHRMLITALVHGGREQEACTLAARMLRAEPTFRIARFEGSYAVQKRADLALFLRAFERTQLPA
ncbi:adenylate/guanylate cyclase domain-containing protein [Pseudorhodoferax sp. Leaf267]|uniref:adenylate/guanylate cyclase domain-containing protein n=1 Tax=Pseudorhodoferax sp. Leaf267 TaxID=1736316 RepID=UPI0006F1C995|nr:adenylate/guanylate cyclase domain-containing protein [Pseudorhodoferax sp. Leaf267]KQP18035.1 hypothetical protein ASF43_09275 [Pseudorhodoferax sp. Leaf267]